MNARRLYPVCTILLLLVWPLTIAEPTTRSWIPATPLWCAPSGDQTMQILTIQFMRTLLPNSVLVADPVVIYASQYDPAAVVAVQPETGRELWRHAVELGRIFLAPHVFREMVIYAATMSGRVQVAALDIEDGAVLWSIDLSGGMATPPVADDNSVYLDLADGGLVAIDAASGAIRWSHDSDPRTGPLVRTGTLLLSGLMSGEISALDTLTGRELWRRPIDGQSGWAWTAAASADLVYFTAWNGIPAITGAVLYALDPRTGDLRWTFQSPEQFFTAPSTNENTVFVARGDGALVALDSSSGELVWEWRLGDDATMETFVGPPPSLDGGVLFSASTTYQQDTLAGAIHALDVRTGLEQWRIPTVGLIDTLPIRTGNIIIAGQFTATSAAQICAFEIPSNTFPPLM